MTSLRRLAPLLLALVLAFAAAGCGDSGPSKDDYISDAKAIGSEITSAGTSLQSSQANTPQELAAELDKLKAKLDTAIKKFEDLKPPDDVKDAHAKTLDAFKGFESDLAPVQAAARSGDVAKLKASLSGGFPSMGTRKLITDAQKLYKDAGYETLSK